MRKLVLVFPIILVGALVAAASAAAKNGKTSGRAYKVSFGADSKKLESIIKELKNAGIVETYNLQPRFLDVVTTPIDLRILQELLKEYESFINDIKEK